MKKTFLITHIFLLWIAMCVPNAQAADFSVTDSDRDVYHIGDYIGRDLTNDLYRVTFYEQSSVFPTAEGILIFDEFYQSFKITIYENQERYGFTLEGHWSGSGSLVFFIFITNENGRDNASFGELQLFLGDRLPRKGVQKTSVKKNLKKKNLKKKKMDIKR